MQKWRVCEHLRSNLGTVAGSKFQVPCATCHNVSQSFVAAATCRELFAYQICLQQAKQTFRLPLCAARALCPENFCHAGGGQGECRWGVTLVDAAHDSNYINISFVLLLLLLTCNSPTPPPTPLPSEVSDNLRLRSRSSLMSICAFCSHV